MINGQTIVITGAFGALGIATAVAAADQGARLCLIDRADQTPPEVLKACGSSGLIMSGIDIAKAGEAAKAVAICVERLGAIDALINIAGTFRWATLSESSANTWDDLYDINVKTVVNMCASVVPHLRTAKRGSIVNIGANAALKAASGMGPYAASKSAVHRLTESLAEELKGEAIRVNAVLPSIIDTVANRRDMTNADFGTWVSPQGLAEVILFLVSSASREITGALISVTGRV